MVESRSITQQIEDYVARVEPTSDHMDKIIEVYEILRDIIRNHFKDLNLLMYGSVVNSLLDVSSREASDLDLSLINEKFTELEDINHCERVL